MLWCLLLETFSESMSGNLLNSNWEKCKGTVCLILQLQQLIQEPTQTDTKLLGFFFFFPEKEDRYDFLGVFASMINLPCVQRLWTLETERYDCIILRHGMTNREKKSGYKEAKPAASQCFNFHYWKGTPGVPSRAGKGKFLPFGYLCSTGNTAYPLHCWILSL